MFEDGTTHKPKATAIGRHIVKLTSGFFPTCTTQSTVAWPTWPDRCCGTAATTWERSASAVPATACPTRNGTSCGSASHATRHTTWSLPSRRASLSGLPRSYALMTTATMCASLGAITRGRSRVNRRQSHQPTETLNY